MNSFGLKIIGLFIGITAYSISFAQSDSAFTINLEKYWNYRHNLTTNFMKVGIGQGMSLPASNYNPQYDCLGYYDCPRGEGMGLMNWGDATINLGEYISVLVSEYVLLEKHQQNTEQTLYELYCAMLAIDRLDRFAETTFGFENSAENLNGFYLRDDVTDSMLVKINNGASCLKSDYKCFSGGNYMSHDQLLGIMLGLLSITELLDEGVAYKDYRFNKEAKIMADRMINYVRNKSWELEVPGGSKVSRGHEIKWAAYPFAKMAQRITGKKYKDVWTQTIAQSLWKFGQYPFIAGHNFTFYNPSKKGPDELVYNDVNSALFLRMAVLSDGWRPKKIAANSIDAAMELNILQDEVFNKRDHGVPATYYEVILNDAPMDGLKFYFHEENVSEQWNSTDRWGHPRFRKTGTRHGGQQGHYVGLDYMMLFNFYCLAFPENVVTYQKNESQKLP